MKHLILIIVACLLTLPAYAQEPIKRNLIVFFDSREESTVRQGLTHRFLEMPANHLGYNIRYYDITQPLPELREDDEMEGIILWFYANMAIDDADAFFDWVLRANELGKKIILIGNLGLSEKQYESERIIQKHQKLMQILGLRDDMTWNRLTYEASILHKDRSLLDFERNYPVSLPPFRSTHALPGTTSHLKISPGDGMEPVDLIVSNANGAYVAENYFIFAYYVDEDIILSGKNAYEIVQWYVNPFKFLDIALQRPLAPVPDTTTLNGRRIFYSHIDGDGWNSLSEVIKYIHTKTISAKVMLEEILKPYSDFPFSVALITGDIDPSCYGVRDSEQVARDIYALPNIEPSSHTHSHPFYWQFFEDYHPDKEFPYLEKYPPLPKASKSLVSAVNAYLDNPVEKYHGHGNTPRKILRRGRLDPKNEEVMKEDYTTPRSYACTPFNLEEEIVGSIRIIQKLAPPHKEVKLIQWSGNTSPYEEALEITRKAGLLNINGGDSRFDREYPSYAWVAPIGLQINNERQIYSSNSNENTYTNLWTDRFFGFRYLQSTVANTESPIRISPFNLYFHIYSAEKNASLNALRDNLEYARSQPVIPIKASEYAEIANGFYSTKILPIDTLSWQILDRGNLQTVRFDTTGEHVVDMQASTGVLGFNHHQGSLYVALDPSTETPVVKLIFNNKNQYINQMPRLIDSRWQINSLQKDESSLTFAATGYGNGEMTWKVTPGQKYIFSVNRESEKLLETTVSADDQGVLQLHFGEINAIKPVNVQLKK